MTGNVWNLNVTAAATGTNVTGVRKIRVPLVAGQRYRLEVNTRRGPQVESAIFLNDSQGKVIAPVSPSQPVWGDLGGRTPGSFPFDFTAPAGVASLTLQVNSAWGATSSANASVTLSPTSMQTVGSDFHPPGYNLVFSDEFNGSSLDRSKWCTRYLEHGTRAAQVNDPVCQPADGSGTLDTLNNELERYVDFNRNSETMHVVAGGTLSLRSTMTGGESAKPFEAAMIRSKSLFRPSATESYYLTARVRLPDVMGAWPAFWLRSGRDTVSNANGVYYDWPPEIDIFEAAHNNSFDPINMMRLGGQPQNWGGTGVKKTAYGQTANSWTYPTPISTDVTSSFKKSNAHYCGDRTVYDRWMEVGAEWKEKEICYFVDGVKTACEGYEWKHNDGRLAPAAHLLLNLAIGESWAGQSGIDASKFPTAMKIDYVRVFRK